MRAPALAARPVSRPAGTAGAADSTDQASRQSFGNYGVINLRAQKVLSRTAGYTALATADLNNLTDRQYRMPFDFRDPGISGFAGVEVRY